MAAGTWWSRGDAARLRRRNAEGKHDFAASDADFDVITSYFQPPGGEEGLNVLVQL